jgi:DNA-binding transcriptional MocR family regulator
MTPLRIDADAAALRRRLGPVPWFVLEELLLLSDATTVVNIGVRALAAGLSLNKDTVARAIGHLRDEGLVVAQTQALHAGRFGAGRYQIGALCERRRNSLARRRRYSPPGSWVEGSSRWRLPSAVVVR